MDPLTPDQRKAIRDAILREIDDPGLTYWDELKDRTVADFCSANEDALTDDLLADYSTDSPEFKAAAAAHVIIYRELLDMDPVTRAPLSGPAVCDGCGSTTFNIRVDRGTYSVTCAPCGTTVATGGAS